MADRDSLWTSELNDADGEVFDRFVLEAKSGHYAQTRAWAKVATEGRPLSARYFMRRDAKRVIGAALVLRGTAGPLPLPFAMVERGPVVADPGDLPDVLSALISAAHLHGVFRLHVQPYWADAETDQAAAFLGRAGFRDVQTFDGPHASTIRVDLATKTEEAVFAGKAREQVRWRTRQAERAGVTARRGERPDFEEHIALSGQLLSAQGKRDKPRRWYDALWSFLGDSRRGAFFVCEHERSVLGSVVALRHGALATYAYGATSAADHKFSKSILPLVLAVKWARNEGCTAFDLGGVPLEGDPDAKRVAIAMLKADFSKTRTPLVREHARWL